MESPGLIGSRRWHRDCPKRTLGELRPERELIRGVGQPGSAPPLQPDTPWLGRGRPSGPGFVLEPENRLETHLGQGLGRVRSVGGFVVCIVPGGKAPGTPRGRTWDPRWDWSSPGQAMRWIWGGI